MPPVEFENTFGVTPTFGASLTRTTQGWFDLEADVTVAPGFFGNRTPDDGFQYGDSLLISAMGNVVVRPLKAGTWVGLSPYAAAGAGLFHTRIADPNDAFDASGNQLAFDAGGGVTASRSVDGCACRSTRATSDAAGPAAEGRARSRDRLAASFWRIVARRIGYPVLSCPVPN